MSNIDQLFGIDVCIGTTTRMVKLGWMISVFEERYRAVKKINSKRERDKMSNECASEKKTKHNDVDRQTSRGKERERKNSFHFSV